MRQRWLAGFDAGPAGSGSAGATADQVEFSARRQRAAFKLPLRRRVLHSVLIANEVTAMSDLNLLLRRLNQSRTRSQADHLETAAAATLLALLGMVALASLL
jgi:hypothetical protein